jgi:hypothetical protein
MVRGTTWLLATSVVSAGFMEVLEVGPHYQSEPTEQQKLVYHACNVTGGAVAALVAMANKRPETALGARSGRILSRPQLRLAYMGIGAVAGYFLPPLLASVSALASRARNPDQQ